MSKKRSRVLIDWQHGTDDDGCVGLPELFAAIHACAVLGLDYVVYGGDNWKPDRRATPHRPRLLISADGYVNDDEYSTFGGDEEDE